MSTSAGADDALMLNTEGYVSEPNATNIFFVHGEELLTPHADFCLPGITRRTIIDLACGQVGIGCTERRLSPFKLPASSALCFASYYT